MRQISTEADAIELPLDGKEFANLILDWAEAIAVPITPMKLQKLLYYCHADFLSLYGKPLIDDQFEAWQFGPVMPSVFQEFKQFSGNPISSRAKRFNPVTAVVEVAPPCSLGDAELQVKALFNLYVRFSATSLSNMSHVENGPWSEALARFDRGVNPGRRISNDLIRGYHQGIVNPLH